VSFYNAWDLDEHNLNVTSYLDRWRLEAAKGGSTYNAEVGLLLDTPIVFAFPEEQGNPLWEQRWPISGVSAAVIVLTAAMVLTRRLRL